MKINFVKLLERAVMPTKAHATDAGFDRRFIPGIGR